MEVHLFKCASYGDKENGEKVKTCSFKHLDAHSETNTQSSPRRRQRQNKDLGLLFRLSIVLDLGRSNTHLTFESDEPVVQASQVDDGIVRL